MKMIPATAAAKPTFRSILSFRFDLMKHEASAPLLRRPRPDAADNKKELLQSDDEEQFFVRHVYLSGSFRPPAARNVKGDIPAL
jgi:hypothetical protein